MENEEIKKQIEQEKEEMKHFLRLAKKLGFPEEEIQKQTDFYLDKISELLKKIN